MDLRGCAQIIDVFKHRGAERHRQVERVRVRFGIAGGTDQIQRSIIGEHLLGLPR